MANMNLIGQANKNQEQLQIFQDQKYHPNLEESASCFSRFFFFYTHKLMKKGADLEKKKEYLSAQDLFDCTEDTHPKTQQKLVQDILNQNRGDDGQIKKDQKIFTLIMRNIVNGQHKPVAAYMIIGQLLQFSGPLMLQAILQFLEDDDAEMGRGYIYASVILVCFMIRVILMQRGLHIVQNYQMTTQNGFSGLLVEKILKMASSSKKYFDAGKIMNFTTVDQQMVFFMALLTSQAFSAPFMIIISIVLICLQLGFWGLLTPLLFIISFMVQGIFNQKIFNLRSSTLLWKDKRAKAVYEYFSGIRIIKYYAWEEVVTKKIEEIRKNEAKFIIQNSYIRTIIDSLSNVTPLLISIIVIICYIAAGNDLKPSKAYGVLALFNLIMHPIKMLTFTLIVVMQTKASQVRMDHFMEAEERKSDAVQEDPNLPKGTIQIENGKFGWETLYAFQHQADSQKNDFKLRRFKGKKLDTELNRLQKEENDFNQKNLTVLQNINFKAQSGELIAIVGQVASGKTSFLHALLGELNTKEGRIARNGKVAYISQTAWMQNATLKENILFGKEYDAKKFNKIIDLCELRADIEVLPGGDQVEIGERGVNLSGGQKQRLAIARAVYAEADIYIIDDCLSALDAHVGKNIFNNVLKGILQEKTIIFVTHALQYMPQVSKVVVLKGGQIVEQGTYQELTLKQNSEFQKLAVQMKKQEEEEEDNLSDNVSFVSDDSCNYSQFGDYDDDFGIANEFMPDERLRGVTRSIDQLFIPQSDDKETRELKKIQRKIALESKKGSVSWRVYANYMSSGGRCTFIMVVLSLILAQGRRVVSDWWIGVLAEDTYNLTTMQYALIYLGTGILVAFFFIFRGILFAQFGLQCANTYQNNITNKLLHTPMSWFDVTPTGRIISRCTKDQDDLDNNLPFSLQNAIVAMLTMISAVLLIVIILPLFFLIAVIVSYVFIKAVSYYLISVREIKRIEANAKSPVISSLQEMINGTYIIRGFGREDFFRNKYLHNQHAFIVSLTNYNYTQKWISIITETFAVVIIVGACYFAVLSKEFNYINDSSTMGLAISWAFQISTILSFALRMVADAESQMNSLVRMLQYIELNPQEREWDEPKPKQGTSWPQEGKLEINKITYKYRPELPEVIKGISFQINSKEKVGIVGRTGSGKSTMTLGLLRILELSQSQEGHLGEILLDSQDISKVGLHVLREKCTIIPQDPILFTGTIRFNIDPFGKYSDQEVIQSLKQVQMWDQLIEFQNKTKENKQDQVQIKIQEQQDNGKKLNQSKTINNKTYEEVIAQYTEQQLDSEQETALLNTMVDDGGDNFSLGQRQLFCMARALIRKPKVLLMDEATASIDEMTDHLIQKMIKNVFKDTTVITIAHRINTIMQYDKIVVLDKGNIVEIDSPINLIKKGDGLFASLVNEGGEEYKKKMIYLAQNKDSDITDY